MAKVILDISMSVDGFITGPNDNQEQPLGIGGQKLHNWLFNGELSSKYNEFFKLLKENRDVFDESIETTGAILVGRRTFDIVGGWGGNHPVQGVPVFVVTHSVPEDYPHGSTTFTFVTQGIEHAVKQAKVEAGHKNVSVGSANVAQQCIKAGLLDEIQIHIAPILLGGGIRLFDHIGSKQIELKSTKVISSPNITHLTYQILK